MKHGIRSRFASGAAALLLLTSMVQGAADSPGRGPTQWRAQFSASANLMHKNVYPGVDLIFSGSHVRLNAQLIVHPGANLDAICLDMTGAQQTQVGAEVQTQLPAEKLTMRLLPVQAFQALEGKQLNLEAAFVQHEDGSVGIAVKEYNAKQPLIITLTAVFQPIAKIKTDESAMLAKGGAPTISTPPGPVITATKTDQVVPDADNDGSAIPGETIKYTVTITNTGTDATNTVYNDTVDPNTTFTPGSLKTTPLAYSQTVNILEDTPTLITLTGKDADGGNLIFATTSSPIKGSNGSIAQSPPSSASLTYTPNANANDNTSPAGADGFSFKVTDSDANIDNAAVTINITPVNDAPTFSCGPDQTHNNTDGPNISVPGWATSITRGPATATDETGQVLTFNLTGNTTPGIFSVNPAVDPSNGNLTYTLSGVGGQSTISFTLSDNGGTANGGDDTSDPCSFTVTVNGPPLAVNDPNGGLPSNSTPSNDGTVVGTDHPYHTALNTTLTVPDGSNDLLANDNLGFPIASIISYGTTGSPGTQTSIGSATPTNQGGSVTVQANGSFSYTPPSAAFTGLDQFAYVINNGTTPSTATVTVAVGARPVAVADSRTATGNVRLSTATNLFTNDAGDQIMTVAFDATSVQGGNVTVSANGDFIYNPPPGYEGSDSFTYTVGNGFGNAPAATVTITVSGMIWFINNTAGVGDGRLTSPFNSLTAFTNNGIGNNPAAGDNFFIYTGSGNYTGGITLLTNQKLIGQGATGTLAGIAGITLAPGSDALPTLGGTNPVIVNAAGFGVSLPSFASGNTLSGFSIGNCAAASLSGSNFGTLTVSDVTINTNAQALSLSNGTAAGSGFTSVTSSSGTNGVSLTSIAGTLNLGTGSLSGSSGSEFLVDGGTANITYNGTITQNSAPVVNVQNKTGGTVTFGGLVSTASGSTGRILLNSNTGATINFTGGVSISSTTSTAFTATSGGTVNVTGASNSLTTTTGTALNVANTTIGVSGLTFQSITSNGIVSANGIILDNTGTSGGLTVTGTGTAGSGGTIANKNGSNGVTTSGIGIYLNSTGRVRLSWMQLNDFQNFAIRGTGVTDFQMKNSIINGVNGNNAVLAEGSVSFDNLFERALFDGVSISGGYVNNIIVTNTSGTLDTMVVTNSTIGLNDQIFGNDGILVKSQNSAVVSLSITNTSFLGARIDMVETNAIGTSTFNLLIKDNTFNNTHPNIQSGSGGIGIFGGSAGGNIAMNYEVSGTSSGSQTFRGASGNAIDVKILDGSGSVTGLIRNNNIGNSSFSGSGSTDGSGILIGADASIVHSATIENNSIVEVDGFSGINTFANGASTLNLTVTGNNISGMGGFVFAGMTFGIGDTAGDTAVLCSDIRNNTINSSGYAFAYGVSFSQASALAHYNLPQYGGATGGATASTDITTYLTGRGNTLTPGASASAVQASSTSGITGTGTGCTL